MTYNFHRRDFLKASAAIAAFNILPSGAYSASPNGKLRTAHIGVGGMGGSDLRSVSSHAKVEVAIAEPRVLALPPPGALGLVESDGLQRGKREVDVRRGCRGVSIREPREGDDRIDFHWQVGPGLLLERVERLQLRAGARAVPAPGA